MLAECGRGSISLQSPVTYQAEMDQCKRSFESVMPDCYLVVLFTSKASSNSLKNGDIPFQRGEHFGASSGRASR